MSYVYKLEVHTVPESTLIEIETELTDFFKIKSKVDEIISGHFDVPPRIKKEVLSILGLPCNINVWYVLESNEEKSWEISCVPTNPEDLEFDIC